MNNLDTSRSYRVRGADECSWRFTYLTDTSDFRGVRWGWRAYRRAPGETQLTAYGWFTESEVLNRMETFGPLDVDDQIDLAIYLRAGGFEEFLGIPLEESHQEATPWQEPSTPTPTA